MSKITKVIIFDNGNIAVFDERGEQVPDLQNPWLNFKGIMKLAKAVAKDKPTIQGHIPVGYDVLGDYVRFYKSQSPKPISHDGEGV